MLKSLRGVQIKELLDFQQLQIVDAVIRCGVNRTGDSHLILESQIAVVADAQLRQLVLRARLL